jgi:hypothetical protein
MNWLAPWEQFQSMDWNTDGFGVKFSNQGTQWTAASSHLYETQLKNQASQAFVMPTRFGETVFIKKML